MYRRGERNERGKVKINAKMDAVGVAMERSDAIEKGR